MKALSIRQPWAWLIAAGWKDIENRTWRTQVRGRVLIHAGKGMTGTEYANVHAFLQDTPSLRHILPHLPKPADLVRGAVIGAADITGCVDVSDSPWFFGPHGFRMANAIQFAEPIPMRGALGFFPTGITEDRP